MGITTCIQYALERLGLDVPGVEDLLWCIGPPLQESFAKLAGEEKATAAVELYRERFSSVGWLENQPYGGISETLGHLVDSGINLHVATSKPLIFAQQILDHFELSRHFDCVFGAELDGTLSYKGELLSHALYHTGFPASASMVGDRKHDMIGATSNGIAGVGVTYGYGSLDELLKAGASHTVSRHQDLLSYFIR